MKFLLTSAVSVLLSAVIISFLPVFGEAQLYEDVLRLHVLAESDSEEDQALKLQVRDAVLGVLTPVLSQCESYDEAESAVAEMEDDIITAAENCIREQGYDYSVTVELGREVYPRRDYGEAVFPAGEYNSLRVNIGSGQGKNWWCVLFPSVCTRFSTALEEEYVEAGFTPREYRIITGQSGKYKVRFKILEIISELFG